VFFAKPDSTLNITSLEQAKQYSVGGYNGDAVAEYLAVQGFAKLQLASNDRANAKKLEAGRIELWALTWPIWKSPRRPRLCSPSGKPR
jgi:polar amino acid transport system substrate-binding protein